MNNLDEVLEQLTTSLQDGRGSLVNVIPLVNYLLLIKDVIN